MEKTIKIPKTKDIRIALMQEGKHGHFHVSGHILPQQGKEYVELRNVTFICDKNYIIDAPEYDELKDLSWYAKNYEPLIVWQLPNVVQKLVDDPDTRQAVLQFYDPDKWEKEKQDMICTMYSSFRMDTNKSGDYFLTYTVHMRSSDIREFRSDIRWHNKLVSEVAKALSDKLDAQVWSYPTIWYADSLQCWDKDWEWLTK